MNTNLKRSLLSVIAIFLCSLFVSVAADLKADLTAKIKSNAKLSEQVKQFVIQVFRTKISQP